MPSLIWETGFGGHFYMDKYEYKRPENEELVEVTVPSGNIFLFRKPSLFSMMFQLGKLP